MRLSGHKKVDSLDDCHKVASVKKLDVRTGGLKSACLEYLTSAPNELKGCIFVPNSCVCWREYCSCDWDRAFILFLLNSVNVVNAFFFPEVDGLEVQLKVSSCQFGTFPLGA